MSLWLLIGVFVIKLIKVYLFGHLVQCPLNSQKAGKEELMFMLLKSVNIQKKLVICMDKAYLDSSFYLLCMYTFGSINKI